jgi:protease-4
LIVLAVVVAIAALSRHLAKPDIPDGSALVVSLTGEYLETSSAPLVAQLLGLQQPSLLGALSELRKAERDPRISHVVFKIRDLQVGWAKAQELRAQIEKLSEAGRHPVAHVEIPGFGGNLSYYIASAADEVYLTPGSGAPLLGLAQEHFFLGGLWKELHVDLEVFQAGRYKSAVENLAGEGMSEAYREQAESLLDSINEHFLGDIAESRSLSREAVERILASAPSDPALLESAGIIDGVATAAELFEALGRPKRVTAQTYSAVDPESVGFEPEATLALIYASGAIVSGSGRATRSGTPVIAADTLVEAIEKAAADSEARAIVVRIDSPGGAPGPSELIWKALRRARSKKPVVASFSDYAASGGYYLASAADAIIASPSTITGSIGVFAVRPSLGRLFETWGVHAESSARAPHAGVLAVSQPLSEETHAWLEADVAAVYRRFLERVAEGRDVGVEEIEAVAGGRVWTGAQAAERGLVDGVGGMREALREAKQRAGLDPESDAMLVVYPPPQPLAEQIREVVGLRVAQLGPLPGFLKTPLRRLRVWMAAAALPGPALVAPFWVEIH